MNASIEITFKAIKCKKCEGCATYAVLKGNRYGLYCGDCGAFIKWADGGQTAVINARKEWLKNHEQSND